VIEKQQQEVMQQISDARKAGADKLTARDLWIKLHPEVPTIEDFADCFRAVEAAEKKQKETLNTKVDAAFPKKQQPAKGK